MEIAFKSRKLEKCYLSYKEAEKAYGARVARKFIERVNIIKAASSLDELRALPALGCHQLKGDRADQWVLKLTDRHRLVFRVVARTNTKVQIVEVSNHYGD